MSLVSNLFGLWWVAVTATLAAAVTFVGGMRGVSDHRVPRLMLAVSVAAIAVSYWVDIFDERLIGAEMRRGAGYILWPALLWTAWSGIVYSRRRTQAVTDVFGDE